MHCCLSFAPLSISRCPGAELIWWASASFYRSLSMETLDHAEIPDYELIKNSWFLYIFILSVFVLVQKSLTALSCLVEQLSSVIWSFIESSYISFLEVAVKKFLHKHKHFTSEKISNMGKYGITPRLLRLHQIGRTLKQHIRNIFARVTFFPYLEKEEKSDSLTSTVLINLIFLHFRCVCVCLHAHSLHDYSFMDGFWYSLFFCSQHGAGWDTFHLNGAVASRKGSIPRNQFFKRLTLFVEL